MLCPKISKSLYRINRVINLLDRASLRKFVFFMVHSYLSYGMNVDGAELQQRKLYVYCTPVILSCGNVEEKFGIGVIFLGTEEEIREKHRNSDTSGPCSRIKLNVDSKMCVMLIF